MSTAILDTATVTTAAPAGAMAGRVARGAELLDRVRPGWAAKIAVDRLGMESCWRCLLGQLYGHYLDGVIALWGRAFVGQPAPGDPPHVHGFVLVLGDYEAFGGEAYYEVAYAALADRWRAEIRRRLGPPAATGPNPGPADVPGADVPEAEGDDDDDDDDFDAEIEEDEELDENDVEDDAP
jgi:hypothetical protein